MVSNLPEMCWSYKTSTKLWYLIHRLCTWWGLFNRSSMCEVLMISTYTYTKLPVIWRLAKILSQAKPGQITMLFLGSLLLIRAIKLYICNSLAQSVLFRSLSLTQYMCVTYLDSGLRFSTAVCVWLVVKMETFSPSGPFVVEMTSYSVNKWDFPCLTWCYAFIMIWATEKHNPL